MSLKLATELGRKITAEEMDNNFRFLEALLGVRGMELRETGLVVYVHNVMGDDANDGLTELTAKKTIQAAVNLVSQFHHGMTVPTVRVAPGTYNEAIDLPGLISDVPLFKAYIDGMGASPAQTLINGTSGSIGACFRSAGSLGWYVRNMKLTNTTGNALASTNGGMLFYGNIDFGAVGGAHVYATTEGLVNGNAAYTISGNAIRHYHAVLGGIIEVNGRVITALNSPVFTTFARAAVNATVFSTGSTFNGTVNGQRYLSEHNGVIFVGGAGSNYFPGNVPGALNNGIYN